MKSYHKGLQKGHWIVSLSHAHPGKNNELGSFVESINPLSVD